MTKPSKRLRDWTDRDTAVMTFLGQQWCADIEAVMLATGVRRRRAYQLIDEWRDEFGMIQSDCVRRSGGLDPSYTLLWLRPSKVEQFLGWKPSQKWTATRDNVVHKVMVSRVRAALCGLDTRTWMPERQLFRNAWSNSTTGGEEVFTLGVDGLLRHSRWRGGSHIHDGRYRDPSGRWWSVEVELTLKQPATRLGKAVLAAYRAMPEGDLLVYLYGSERIYRAVAGAVEELMDRGALPAYPRIAMMPLDKVIAYRSFDLPAGIEAAS